MFRNKITIYSDFPVTINTNPENKVKHIYTGAPGTEISYMLTVIHNQSYKRMSFKSYTLWFVNQIIGLYREFWHQMSLDLDIREIM